ncbi:histidine phosphatase family protein [Antiquaquibacter oligotrophicus]|nr:histidine phosphatase family protein [Antiquaquibacter oligotrophicus]UDF14736.1 histidine phosphatase family protein [Antiquaquibacter oligotrophicus]
MRLLLIRHGQTPSNVEGLLDTAAPGPGLTELGHRQAAQIPDALRAESIDGIWVSTLRRTHLTAAPLAASLALSPVQLDGLHEIAAGELELRRDHEAVRIYLETVFAWGLGDRTPRMPGGEDGHEFFRRFDSSIREVASSGAQTAAVVSHGAAIRVWVAGSATNVAPSYAGEHDIQNTGIIELEGDLDSGWRLLAWQGTPIGGSDLVDADANDPTGETLDDALDET